MMYGNVTNSSGILYRGDDIGAIVIDVGSCTLRAGYAHEDFPKAEIPSAVGILEEIEIIETCNPEQKRSTGYTNTSLDAGAGQYVSSINNISEINVKKKYYTDWTALCMPNDNVDIVSFMKDGMIENWELFERVLDYIYNNCIRSDPKLHPVLMSEYTLNTPTKREKLMELMFEKYNIPAFFLVKSAVLSAYANGRISALVLDSGATFTSAIPVHEGYVLSKAVVNSPFAGDFLSMQCKKMFEEKGIDVVPTYMIGNKQVVKEEEKAIWSKRRYLPEVNSTFHNYMVKRVLRDFQQSVLHISEIPLEDRIITATTFQPFHYEFPNGYHQDFGEERFAIPELLFKPPRVMGGSLLGVSSIISTSIDMCDVAIRPSLYNGIVLSGGTTCIPGFSERLVRDMSRCLPSNARLKIIASPGNTDRRFSAWIGASILASVGTFQQMWISKQEYDEYGKSQLGRKCP